MPATLTPAGVSIQVIEEGTGAVAEPGKMVTVEYVGWLQQDGTKFDSSIDRGRPLEFVLGAAPIAGWDEGLAGMKVGGTRRLIVPPDLAYGETGRGPIPPNATLVFDMKLVDVQ
ncbi:MAG: FKBP-type peptidyl-prolyl cis-trans isomerase [Candidatus Zixiibacteriota bacterium]|nr:MAG: FKBP-type peptidyl-prolyl cis-trans isomerase [candidate division Zixibacteria bacterium]